MPANDDRPWEEWTGGSRETLVYEGTKEEKQNKACSRTPAGWVPFQLHILRRQAEVHFKDYGLNILRLVA